MLHAVKEEGAALRPVAVSPGEDAGAGAGLGRCRGRGSPAARAGRCVFFPSCPLHSLNL